MIQPVKFNSNVSFQADNNLYKDFKDASAPQEESKGGVKEAAHKVRAGFLNTVKGVNKAAGVGTGAVRGIVDGTALAVLVGVIGKNVKEADGQIAGAVSGTIKDLAKGAVKAVKAVPSLFTKSVLQNVASAAKAAKDSVKDFAKNNKAAAAAAVVTGTALAVLRTFQGKWSANTKNANIDHALNEGHNPIK